jgi:hypothetical protein
MIELGVRLQVESWGMAAAGNRTAVWRSLGTWGSTLAENRRSLLALLFFFQPQHLSQIVFICSPIRYSLSTNVNVAKLSSLVGIL